jgi:hypothetical protein
VVTDPISWDKKMCVFGIVVAIMIVI